MAKNYYAILRVSPDAEQEVIRAAYKVLMLKYHPGTNRSDAAAAGAKATLINEAFAVLGDPERRRECDVQLKAREDAAKTSNGRAGEAQPSGDQRPTPPPPPWRAHRPLIAAGRARKGAALLLLVITGAATAGAVLKTQFDVMTAEAPVHVPGEAVPVPSAAVIVAAAEGESEESVRDETLDRTTAPLPPELAQVISFSNADTCEYAEPLLGIFESLLGNEEIAVVPGVGKVPITRRKLRTGEPDADWAENIAEIPLQGRWLGLRTSRLAVVSVPESDGISHQIRFLESPERVRSAMNRLAFDVPPPGEFRVVEPDAPLSTAISIESIPGGSSFSCST